MSQAHQIREQSRSRLLDERGTLRKEAPWRVALAYPSPYHVGMSSLGFQAIYRALNAMREVAAERVFLPDDVEAFKAARLPLYTLESEREVRTCPVIAFSVAYELELHGLFSVLELAGIPARREERDEAYPLVVAGGPLTFSNPDPLEPFVDVLVQGEAEGLVVELLEAVKGATSRDSLLASLAERPGFRVPGRSRPTSRYFVAKVDDALLPAHSQIVTPHTELRDMFLVEPARGCSRGCHYCVMRRTTNGGMRVVPKDTVLGLVPADARRVGLVGAAVTDHPKIHELLEALVAQGREVGVSSLRADRLTQRLVNALKAGGARGLTVASDGASQRMRDLVDRKHTETQLIAAATFAKAAGIERLKLYQIVGLPLETDEDIDELVRFTRELSKILPVALGVAPFSAKRQTPLDGAPFAGIDVVEARLKRLRKGLQGKAEVRPTSARWAYVEHVLAQCGPEAGLAAYDAWKAGGGFSAWKKAFEAHACTPYEARRVADGRHKSTTWPSVGPAHAAGATA
ncbi:MAG: B12-binding domain-containing radical SAM protein [Myxococcaceae bacterium]|nr:B12-binding domain-containing radical SAM protein [Myxococcaceae bacterium]